MICFLFLFSFAYVHVRSFLLVGFAHFVHFIHFVRFLLSVLSTAFVFSSSLVLLFDSFDSVFFGLACFRCSLVASGKYLFAFAFVPFLFSLLSSLPRSSHRPSANRQPRADPQQFLLTRFPPTDDGRVSFHILLLKKPSKKPERSGLQTIVLMARGLV